MTYVAVFSTALVALDYIDLSGFAYATENGTSTILGPLVAGVITGACYSILVKGGTLTGGMDFVASLIHKKKPHTNLFWVLFLLNCSVAGMSYFVYGFKLEPAFVKTVTAKYNVETAECHIGIYLRIEIDTCIDNRA